MKKLFLVIIDPQNDFCDPNKGSLYVKGAEQDMARLAAMIRRLGDKIDDIYVTLDSHHTIHVAHPIYWKNSNGDHPAPFTIIAAQDVANGVWTTTNPHWMRHTRKDFGALDYVKALEANQRYPLCIWPPHCLIGSWGHAIYPPLFEALCEWETKHFGSVQYVTKGSNYHTEHYSPFTADVPDPNDHTTSLNTAILDQFEDADVILWSGEAGSHCLANAGRDADKYFADASFVKKLTLLKDATSPVPGFENLQDQFVKDMLAKGMKESTTVDFLS